MLDTLRRGANNWLSKFILGLIMLSFVAFGITTRLPGMGGSDDAMEIGGSRLSVQDFDRQYNRELEAISARVGKPVTRQDAAAFGFNPQIISDIVRRTLLIEEGRQLGLGVSDEHLRQLVVNDPAFKGASGQYDPAVLDRQLYYLRMTRDDYVAERRKDEIRQQINEALVGGVKTPKAMLEVLNTFAEQERIIRYVSLDASTLGEIAPATDDELKTFFEARKAAFKAPELRKLQIVVIDPAKVSKADDISDDDAKAAYDRTIQAYVTPEKRRIEQLPFDSREAADAAAKRLSDGTTFDTLITELKLKPEDIDQGLLARNAFADPVVAEAAFKLAKTGDVSGVIAGRFRNVLIRLTEISREERTPFETVKPAIKASLAAAKADALVRTLLKQIEAARDERATLADIAKRFNLDLQTIEAIDRDGKDAGGKPVDTLPEPDKIAKAAFDTDIGNQNDPLTLGNGGSLFYDVVQITPPRDRTLDEVRSEIAQRWKDEQVRNRLADKAKEIVGRVEKGETLDEVAKASGLEVKTTGAFKRSDKPDDLPPAVVAAAFNGAEGTISEARTEGDGRIVLQVKDVTDPVFFAESDTLKQPSTQLETSLKSSLQGEYLRRLQSVIGVRMNQQVVSQITGQPTRQN